MGTICCIIGIMRKLFNDYNFLTLNYYETDFKKTFPKKKGRNFNRT